MGDLQGLVEHDGLPLVVVLLVGQLQVPLAEGRLAQEVEEVVTLVGPWRAWFDALCEILDGASDSECAKLFSDNAIRVYKLGA